ncbi:hypothetical protein Q9L58_010239 [Maublancomyces gigas]|uniref:Uncharacterized protein n=1 Tax=Discina gigas TaxID=1032678 RepID=A0ABR3G4M0_9PEZI
MPFHKHYLKDIFPSIAPELQYLVWHMTENTAFLTQNINMAHEQISRLRKAVNAQSSAIARLTNTVQQRKSHQSAISKTIAAVAAGAPANQPKVNFKVVERMKKQEHLYQPESMGLNRQVIVETDCPIPDNITDDAILAAVNAAIADLDTGAALSIEINMALNKLGIVIK